MSIEVEAGAFFDFKRSPDLRVSMRLLRYFC